MIEAVIEFEDGNLLTHDSNVKTVDIIFKSGYLSCALQNDGGVKIKREFIPEEHEPFSSKETSKVLEVVNSFFSENIREKVNALGFVHKIGILLYGKQGTGKTSLMHFIANQMIEKLNAVCFLCNSGKELMAAIGIAKEVRKIQPNPIIFICDEFERFARDAESEMKNFLDGKDSIDNMLFLAATNYLEKVPKTIKDRPSRFRVVLEMKGISNPMNVADIIRKMSNKVTPSVFTEKEIKILSHQHCPSTLDEIKSVVLEKISNFVPPINTQNPIGFKSKPTNDDDKYEDNEISLDFGDISNKGIYVEGRGFVELKSDSNI